MRVAGVWVHPVLTGRVLMMAGRFNGEVCMSKLKELVDALEAAGIETLEVRAYGSGDEGTIDEPDVDFKEGFSEEPENLSDLIDEVFDEKGFDYYNGDGGSISLTITVAERKCDWTAYVIEEVFCEDASSEETV